MGGPLEGIKVVEMGVWVAGPSCGAVLADWGADVLKIEPPEGDPCRGLMASLGVPVNPVFEQDNRGKRSMVLNLASAEAEAIAHRLVDEADVFLTNMRPRALEKYGLGYAACAERNPRLVYCQVGGYGPDTSEANRASYDVGAFWSRAGVALSLVPPGQDPPQQRGGMGDHMTGSNAAGAIAAALFARERTGEGQRVAVSLMRMGTYMMSWDLNARLRLQVASEPYDRFHAVNPIINTFKAGDGKWFMLLLLQADRHWPDLMRALDAPELADDPRLQDIPSRREHSVELVTALDEIFAARSYAEWAAIFDREDVWHAPMNTIDDVANDPLASEAGVFVELESPEGPVQQVASPADFNRTPAKAGNWPPELGQHTEEVLLGMGYDWDAIIAMKERGAIP